MPTDRKRKCIMHYAHFKLEEEYKYLKFDFITTCFFFILPATPVIMQRSSYSSQTHKNKRCMK